MRQVKIYDTTLRDGTQAEDFNLSLADKIRIAQKLAYLGIHYIEGGWPGANPKDKDFFSEIRNYELGVSRIAAFGSTHHKDRPPESDPNMQELLISLAPVVTIFGKSSLFQVKEILQTTPERNLELITGSLAYLKPRVEELFYDAEHFFDAFKEDRDYALKTLDAALAGGAHSTWCCATPTAAPSLPNLSRSSRQCRKNSPRRPWESTPTTTRSWPWPTPSPRWNWGAARSRGPSTAWASAAATPTSAPSSPTSS